MNDRKQIKQLRFKQYMSIRQIVKRLKLPRKLVEEVCLGNKKT